MSQILALQRHSKIVDRLPLSVEEQSCSACKKCGREMDRVADILPRGGEPGLRAYVCPNCGAGATVDSDYLGQWECTQCNQVNPAI